MDKENFSFLRINVCFFLFIIIVVLLLNQHTRTSMHTQHIQSCSFLQILRHISVQQRHPLGVNKASLLKEIIQMYKLHP